MLYTARDLQLVLMCLRPGEEIGEEVHTLAQFIRLEAGTGVAILDGVEHLIHAEHAIVVPAGARHNIRNTGTEDMKLYTIYAPPEHKDQTVVHAKADEREEHFDGVTTE